MDSSTSTRDSRDPERDARDPDRDARDPERDARDPIYASNDPFYKFERRLVENLLPRRVRNQEKFDIIILKKKIHTFATIKRALLWLCVYIYFQIFDALGRFVYAYFTYLILG